MAATTTPTKQKAAAKKAAGHSVPQSKAQAGKAKRNAKWRDSAGVELVKGLRVKDADGDVIGTVAYRHSHQIDGKDVGMVGVALTGKGDALVVGGRKVRNRSFRADELTAIPE